MSELSLARKRVEEREREVKRIALEAEQERQAAAAEHERQVNAAYARLKPQLLEAQRNFWQMPIHRRAANILNETVQEIEQAENRKLDGSASFVYKFQKSVQRTRSVDKVEYSVSVNENGDVLDKEIAVNAFVVDGNLNLPEPTEVKIMYRSTASDKPKRSRRKKQYIANISIGLEVTQNYVKWTNGRTSGGNVNKSDEGMDVLAQQMVGVLDKRYYNSAYEPSRTHHDSGHSISYS